MNTREMYDSDDKSSWSLEKSTELYQIRGWGEPYFKINAQGNVEVVPDPDARPERTIDLHALVNDLDARGLELPLLVRFSDILRDRIRRLNDCFAKAINEYGYQGRYRGVFPVKVNQQAHVIDEVVEFGRPWQYGLEAGSKPELLIALAATTEPNALIICNGYKDQRYIETALLAQRFDKTVIVVLERIEELDHALKGFDKTGIRPALGVRAKLGSRGVGRWADSSGYRAKFGLSAAELVEVVTRLKERDMLDCLKLLHFHMGSQISSIIPIKKALREATTIYVELVKMGAAMGYFDAGGGLAVDYDGSKTDFSASKNYNVQEYANDIVSEVQRACTEANIPHPTLVSESGRAVAAHQSVLVFEIIGKNEVRFGTPQNPGPDSHSVLQNLYEIWQGVAPKNIQEAYHDAQQAQAEAESLFGFGYLTLQERAQAERLFWNCCERINDCARSMRRVPEEVQQLEQLMAAIYYGNFSVFQSVPDVWAIDQLFPVMPIHRLQEEPTLRATLADLTCDSDGKIDRFIDVEDVKPVLPVHPLRVGERYLMAMFLNGAYQEILGDLHNLFGDTNAVHVRLDSEVGYHVEHVVKGDAIGQVLNYVEHDPAVMIERVRRQAERAQRQGLITFDQVKMLMQHFEGSLGSYTYLSSDSPEG